MPTKPRGRPLRQSRTRSGSNVEPKEASHATALGVSAYCIEAAKTDRFSGESPDVHYRELSFGFFGEVGSLLSALKKGRRDQLEVSDTQAVREEIGDALWYLVNMASLSNLTAEELARSGLSNLRMCFCEQAKPHSAKITFRAFDGITSLHHAALSRTRALRLQQLAKTSGAVVALPHPEMQKLGHEERSRIFGELLGLLAMVSANYKQSLGEIAQENLSKTADRWPVGKRIHRVLPYHGEVYEQLPDRLQVEFIERKVGSRLVVVQQIKGLNIGDPLTDNSHRADGYRFHDVFHLAYAVHLGWSPVLRALLKLKRKSDSKIDENEDGARAIIIEEGIATWIFNHAKDHKQYAEVQEGRLSYALLKQAREMLSGFQVSELPLWQWEKAILDGFSVFRQLYENRAGIVVADLKNHTLSYQPPLNKTRK